MQKKDTTKYIIEGMWREKSKNDVIEKTNKIITKGNIFRSNLLVIIAE